MDPSFVWWRANYTRRRRARSVDCTDLLRPRGSWSMIVPTALQEEVRPMLSREDNELLTQVDPGTPMGDTLRRYWIPALLSWELPEPDCPPVRVKLLGEPLVAFRDTQGRVGMLEEHCAH